MQVLSTSINEDLFDRLLELCKKNRRSKSYILRIALEKYFENLDIDNLGDG